MYTLILALALGFPDGCFIGHGDWKGEGGDRGRYSVHTHIAANMVCSRYEWEGGGTDEFCFQATFGQDGFFTVEDGWGYCYDYQCHYQVTVKGGTVEETLSFVDDNLFKLGSKKFGQGPRILWQEALLAQTTCGS